jgi:hypothetical protein
MLTKLRILWSGSNNEGGSSSCCLFKAFQQLTALHENKEMTAGPKPAEWSYQKSSIIYSIIKIYGRSSPWRAVLRRATKQAQSSSALIPRLTTSSSRDFRLDHITTNTSLWQTIQVCHRSKAYRGYVKPRIIPNAIYRVIQEESAIL